MDLTHRRPESQSIAAVALQQGSTAGDARFRVAPIALNLKWVASDPALPVDLAANAYLVAAELSDPVPEFPGDEHGAAWWLRRAPRPGVFNWQRAERLIQRHERRAELGPGWARSVKGKEVALQKPLDRGQRRTRESVVATPGPDPQADAVERDLYERIRSRLTSVEWRAVERRLMGTTLTGADRKALCLLRRSPKAADLRLLLGA